MRPRCSEIVPTLFGWQLVNRNRSRSTETLAIPVDGSVDRALATASVTQLYRPLLADRPMPRGLRDATCVVC